MGKTICYENYTVEIDIADINVGRDTLTMYSLLKWFPHHFFTISKETTVVSGLNR
jgi:hypothetical protein